MRRTDFVLLSCFVELRMSCRVPWSASEFCEDVSLQLGRRLVLHKGNGWLDLVTLVSAEL